MPTAYELEREANIARNRALLEELDLKDAVAQLGVPQKPKPTPKAKPIQPAKRGDKRKAEEDLEPRRKSARLRGSVAPPNETASQKRKREKENAEREAKESEERLIAEEAERAAKRPRHYDLDLAILNEDSKHGSDVPSLRTTLDVLVQEPRPRAVGDREAYVFDDDDAEREETELADLRRRMQGLKVVARAKVTQDRVYSAAYHPEPTKDLIFFGDKHGQLGIWDARAPSDEAEDDEDERPPEEREGGKSWQLQMHWPATSKSSISSIKLDPVNSHSLYTTSYDCTIRHFDFVAGVSKEIFATDNELITSVDLPPGGREMWISDAVGGVTRLDLRERRSRAAWYGLSDQKIGCVSVNPVSPHLLLTSSNSKALRIWDARKLRAVGGGVSPVNGLLPATSPSKKATHSSSDNKPLEFSSEVIQEFKDTKPGAGLMRGEWTHGKSVSAAYWDPRGRSVVSTCYDDTLRLWDYRPNDLDKSSKTLPSSRPFTTINYNCQTGKWLTVLKATWTQNTEAYPHFTIGNMHHSLDIFSGKGSLVARLTDKTKITAVQAVTVSHPSIVERAVSGNGSGRCVLWAPADEEEA